MVARTGLGNHIAAAALRNLFSPRTYLSKCTAPTTRRLLQALNRRYEVVRDYRRKLDFGLIERPHYGHCMLYAAHLARALGHGRISCIEFGVAGGNGLLAMERHAALVRAETGVETAVYGFDTGTGMPPPRDYRDVPYLWRAGDFRMDVPKLRASLSSAKLVLGPVEETVQDFFAREDPPPIGFIALDLDYYSSTAAALRILDADHRHFLPRVSCYVDDMIGDVDFALNEFTGALLAVKEFNAAHEAVRVAPVSGVRYFGDRVPMLWHEQVFVAHRFAHPDYATPIGDGGGATRHALGSE